LCLTITFSSVDDSFLTPETSSWLCSFLIFVDDDISEESGEVIFLFLDDETEISTPLLCLISNIIS